MDQTRGNTPVFIFELKLVAVKRDQVEHICSAVLKTWGTKTGFNESWEIGKVAQNNKPMFVHGR